MNAIIRWKSYENEIIVSDFSRLIRKGVLSLNISYHYSVIKKITALLISLCMAASFVPAVNAASDPEIVDSSEYIVSVDDSQTTQDSESTTQDSESTTQATESTTQATESTTQATESTTQATESTTQATESTTQATKPAQSFTQTTTVNSGSAFETVETEGGVLFVGTARTPKNGGGISTVKFVYSSSLNLNDKSLALINKELAACGVTMPEGLIYVSRSDIVSDSQLMTSTSERQAVFAVGSPEAATVLKPYQAYGSVEESFERLFRGYIFSITGYASLQPVLDGRDEVTLSDDGQTASVSIVMSEDYVEKVINGKKIKILMINSELKYYFRAPKLTFVKDEDYNVSDSDVEYHYPTRSTTDPSDTLTEATTEPTSIITQPIIDDSDSSEPDTSETEATKTVTPSTEASDNNGTTSSDDSFQVDDTTEFTPPTKATKATTASTATTDDWDSTSTQSTQSVITHTDPSRLIPYAQPIEPRPSAITTEDYPTQTLPTEPPTEATTKNTTATTEFTIRTTSDRTLPTSTQPTRQDPITDPFEEREQHSVGEAYVNTRRLRLNIRSGPGMNYMIINVLPKGTHLTVLDTTNPDWYMVRLKNGSVGYAYSYYIKFV